jgi:hypothetical protein
MYERYISQLHKIKTYHVLFDTKSFKYLCNISGDLYNINFLMHINNEMKYKFIKRMMLISEKYYSIDFIYIFYIFNYKF